MILADFQCTYRKCGRIEEDLFIESGQWYKQCPACRNLSKRIPSIGRINTVNDDASHIRDAARHLLDPDTAHLSDKVHVRELATNPTRSNLNRFLRAEKIRYAENEGGAPPRYKRPPKPDTTKQREAMHNAIRK